MKLYGRGQSRSFRGVWALLEAEVPFEYIHVDKDNLPPGYEALNSQVKVPTLEDGIVLTESAAIVNYAAACSQLTLIPAEAKHRAVYDDLCYFIMTELEQPLWSVGKHSFAIPEAYRVSAMLETARWEYEKAQTALLLRFDGQGFALSNTAYSEKDGFTMADVLLAQTLNWAIRFEMPVDERLQAYRDTMFERPACQKALEIVTV